MTEIIKLSIADPGCLKNDHNKLFMNLMEKVERTKYVKKKKVIFAKEIA